MVNLFDRSGSGRAGGPYIAYTVYIQCRCRLPRPAVFGPVVVIVRFLGQVMAFAQGAGMSSSKKNPPVREDSMMKVKSAQELDQAATLMR
jgi:hypothetical protein